MGEFKNLIDYFFPQQIGILTFCYPESGTPICLHDALSFCVFVTLLEQFENEFELNYFII